MTWRIEEFSPERKVNTMKKNETSKPVILSTNRIPQKWIATGVAALAMLVAMPYVAVAQTMWSTDGAGATPWLNVADGSTDLVSVPPGTTYVTDVDNISIVSLNPQLTIYGNNSTGGVLQLDDIVGSGTLMFDLANNSTLKIGGLDLGSVEFLSSATLFLTGGTYTYSEVGNFDLGNGTLVLGGGSMGAHYLEVDDWISSGGTLVIGVGSGGSVSTLEVNGSITGTTTVRLAGSDANLNTLVDSLGSSGHVDVITASTSGLNRGLFVLEDVYSSRYSFTEWFENTSGSIWSYKATPILEDITPIDPARDVLMNIVAFDLPMGMERNRDGAGQTQNGQPGVARGQAQELTRAQYTDGPWARVRGGKINDGALALNKNTFQALQVGWDRTVDAVSGGIWNAGFFGEGNWLYGKGDLRNGGNVLGKMSSTTTGVGVGYYLSREFRNLMYIDFVGRTTWFDNNTKNTALDGDAGSYAAAWKNHVFSTGLEVGRTFNSRDNRWVFNPYNRVLYNSTSGKKFDLVYGNNDIANIGMHGYGAWTNRLGGRLTLNNFGGMFSGSRSCNGCNPCDMVACDPCAPMCGHGGNSGRVSSRVFVQGDWYKGISGKFGGTFFDQATGTAGNLGVGRPKHNVSYGVASVGLVLYPTNRMAVTVAGESLFGDINGYGVTSTLKVMF